MMPVRLEPATPRSQVKHSTTKPLHVNVCKIDKMSCDMRDQPVHMRSLFRAFSSHLNILCQLSY